jgi:RNA polymerase sigma factor (sigma-70 family)
MDPDQTRVAASPIAELDGALLERSVVGDGEAFGVLFDRHRLRVFRHACRLAGSGHDAEDLVAATFLELWRSRERVRVVEGSVLPWLLATATNLGLNARRARRRYQRLLDTLPRGGEQLPDTALVALDAHGLGVDARLRSGLRSLKPADAQLFALVALEGYSVIDAAACLGVSEPAARARLHRARQKLEQKLTSTVVGTQTGQGSV